MIPFQMIIDISIAIVFLIILIEDIKERQVHLWLFLIALLFFVIKFILADVQYSYLLINGSFILIQLTGIAFFNYLKNRRFFPFEGILGTGDLFMWGLLLFCFSPFNFITFFIISLLFSFVAHCIISRKYSNTIPLAGWQGLCYVLIIVMQFAGWNYDLYSDYKWIDFISNVIER